jgi:hypothetical protein
MSLNGNAAVGPVDGRLGRSGAGHPLPEAIRLRELTSGFLSLLGEHGGVRVQRSDMPWQARSSGVGAATV